MDLCDLFMHYLPSVCSAKIKYPVHKSLYTHLISFLRLNSGEYSGWINRWEILRVFVSITQGDRNKSTGSGTVFSLGRTELSSPALGGWELAAV